jgi:hypothetical protein
MLNLEKLDNMPIRERMRLHYGWRDQINTYKYRYKIVIRILQSHIGKHFDIVYSKFCFTMKSYQKHRDFLEELNNHWYKINTYYIDNNGLIQKVIKNKSKKPLYIYSDNYKTAIVHKETGHLKDLFHEKWSRKEVIYTSNFNPKWSRTYKENDKFLGYQYKGKYYFANEEDFIEKIISGSRIEVTSPKDYRYKRYWADKLKSQKALNKKENALKQQEYLENQRKLMQKKKRKEKGENDLKILAAGFDLETSFRNRK